MIRKGIVFFCITIVLFGSSLCIDINKNTKKFSYIYKKLDPLYAFLSKKAIQKKIERNRIFSNIFLKNYKMNKEEKIYIQLGIEKLLTSLYKERLKKQYEPNKDVLQSFYLDHKTEFKPIMEVSLISIQTHSLETADTIYKLLKEGKELSLIKKRFPLVIMQKYHNVPLSKFNFKTREIIRKYPANEITEPFKIGNVYFIDKIVEKKEKDISFKNLQKDIKNILLNIYINKKLEDIYNKNITR